MKFFIDTADIDEIRKADEMGLVDGVTTNPSLLSKVIMKTKKNSNQIISEILKQVKGDVSIEVNSLDYEGMIAEALDTSKLGENVCIKIPMNETGMKAVKTLKEKGVKTNVTLVFNAVQAMIAAKAGAYYVSPFIGRLDDIADDGMKIIEDIVLIFGNYDIETKIIVASIRHPMHVLDSMRIGADVATIPYDVLLKLMKHPLTDIGIERFKKDYEKTKNL